MATAKTAFGGGLNSSSGGELKLYLSCTGSTLSDFLDPPHSRSTVNLLATRLSLFGSRNPTEGREEF